jgi:hypothetical protein
MNAQSVAVRNPARQYMMTLAEPGWVKTMAYLQCDPQMDGKPPELRQMALTQAGPFVRLHEKGETARDFASITDARDYLHGRFFVESLSGDLPLLHAACLRHHGKRMLLVGPKNAGKSTLTLALALAGYEVEGDENVFVSLAGVTARPRACRVKESSLEVLPALAALAAETPFIADYHGRKIYNLAPDRLGRPWRIATGKVDAVVLLHANHGGMSSLRKVPPLALSRALMAETAFPAAGKAMGVAAVTALAAGAAGYDLSVGDLKTAISCLNHVMKEE